VTAPSVEALLAGIVDYAGLFPPAALPMERAVREYARWRRSPQAWMLGRFVLPAARLAELSRVADADLPEPDASPPWRLSALLGADTRGDAALVDSFDGAHAGRAVVDAVELKAGSPDDANEALDGLPPGLAAFVEVPLDADLGALLAVLKARGARAKVRTGGVVPEAIPGPSDLARFIVACASAGVPFKATAGLHHPVRGEHALTYEPDAPRAMMHGFLNVFAAAALAREGAAVAEVEGLLREEGREAFAFEPDGLRWRGRRIPTTALLACRASFAASFGSCSFAEPVADLATLGVLARPEGPGPASAREPA
jgi:hypothetical protein